MRELGVGLTYLPGLDPLIEAGTDLIDLLEIEPQNLWFRDAGPGGGYRADRVRLGRLAQMPYAKVLHGVGFPWGSSRRPDQAQLPALLETIELLKPEYMSEHLSFNRAAAADGSLYDTGFLLPPCQNPAGVAAAVRAVRGMAVSLPLPLAVENGVSYLRPLPGRPLPGEMADGAFLGVVAEQAGCGIVLDLHNAWANERNGRQPVLEFLRQVPLQRVWEVHLAGGMEHEGYWLDAHSGAIPPTLLELAAEVIPVLSALKSIIFEISPSYVETVGLDCIAEQLRHLRRLWQLRAVRPCASLAAQCVAVPAAGAGMDGIAPRVWEDTLGALVAGRSVDSPLADMLHQDKGLEVFQHLASEFRASSVAATMPFVGRLLMGTLGGAGFRALLARFWAHSPPEPFGGREAENFSRFLQAEAPEIPYLDDVRAFDLAVVRSLTGNQTTELVADRDLRVVLSALADYRVPERAPAGRFPVSVGPMGVYFHDDAGAAAA
jgi:uncharacterized protein (UPF0276 family)